MDNSVTEDINKQNMEYHEIMCKCNVYAEWCRCIENNNYNNRNMEKLISKVTVWADNKNLLKSENTTKQFCKVAEEVGEVAAALARGDKEMLKDGIGDVIVTLVILEEQQGLSLEECLQAACDEIKDRKGKTVNGTFIKEEDLA